MSAGIAMHQHLPRQPEGAEAAGNNNRLETVMTDLVGWGLLQVGVHQAGVK